MTSEDTMKPGESKTVTGGPVVIRVESTRAASRSLLLRLLLSLLLMSFLLNLVLLSAASSTATGKSNVVVVHDSGVAGAQSAVAIIDVTGTIMPPFTERWLDQMEAAEEDERVKAVIVAVDSPGGLVADSHQLYRRLQQLRKKKPVWVAMKRMAASGGYYLAMGIGTEGRIYCEPTTWTGSIGVIIPRYNAAELAQKVGVQVEPLKTGPLKDALNPFRDLSDEERRVWEEILKDAFDRFVEVIAENRQGLNEEEVRRLATGQIYTASQAIQHQLADEIGYEDDAVQALASVCGLTDYEVVRYTSPPGVLDVLFSRASARDGSPLDQLLQASVPRAMYYCSWNPWIAANQ